METNIFTELLQISLGTRDKLSRVPSDADWKYLLSESKRQAVLGIMSCGIEILPKYQQPPQGILFQWISTAIQIEQRSTLTSETCKIAVNQLKNDNFNVCILKGQANLRYYPERMRRRRHCGDVDVWAAPGYDTRYPIRQVLEYVNDRYEMNGLCWLHCNYTEKNGTPIEIHFRPSFMNDPFYNIRFQTHFADIEKVSCIEMIEGNDLPVMRIDDDVIYQMNHIYRHLLDEGIGLRQIIDYYWLLIAWNKQASRTKEGTMKIIASLGMKRFAHALMYVLREACGMEEEMLLCPVSVKDGEFLMNEVFTSGNFGHFDPRMGDLPYTDGIKRQVSQAYRRFKRNLRFLSSYPREVIWEPFARIYHFAWKKLKMWKI